MLQVHLNTLVVGGSMIQRESHKLRVECSNPCSVLYEQDSIVDKPKKAEHSGPGFKPYLLIIIS